VTFEIVWPSRALRRLDAIRLYVARDKPGAAELLALRIVTVTQALRMHSDLGRAGAEPRLRELIVAGTPYIIVYRVQTKRIVIATIWHAAQRRKR
jgi:toxin ParE1/3/4